MCRNFATGLTIPVLCLTLAACGGSAQKQVFPVRGQVFMGKKPAAGALVVLRPLEGDSLEAWPNGYPRATVEDDGAFRITTYTTYDGAPPGEYAVLIQWMKEQPEEVDVLEGRYADPANPKYRIKVAEGENNLEPYHLK
jgi:hypothetical protein